MVPQVFYVSAASRKLNEKVARRVCYHAKLPEKRTLTLSTRLP